MAASSSITSTRTTIVLETLHETTRLPLDAALPDAALDLAPPDAAEAPGRVDLLAAAELAGKGGA